MSVIVTIYCDRFNCINNNKGECDCHGSLTLDEDGCCEDYIQRFDDWWDRLDDIEREEYNALQAGSEDK